MSASLRGARILVTRPAHQAENLCRLIEQHQGVAERFPTIEIQPLPGLFSATIALKQLSDYSLVIFTSANAVNFALAAIGGKIRPFADAAIAAIGKATARTLEAAAIQVDIVPDGGFDSEILLAMPQLQDMGGKKVLIIRGRGGREKLAETLKARGAKVDYLEVYKRVIPEGDHSRITSLLASNQVDAIIATSAEALENLLFMVGAGYKEKLAAIPVAVVSSRIRSLAEKSGFKQIVVTEEVSDQAIFNAVMAIINEGQRG